MPDLDKRDQDILSAYLNDMFEGAELASDDAEEQPPENANKETVSSRAEPEPEVIQDKDSSQEVIENEQVQSPNALVEDMAPSTDELVENIGSSEGAEGQPDSGAAAVVVAADVIEAKKPAVDEPKNAGVHKKDGGIPDKTPRVKPEESIAPEPPSLLKESPKTRDARDLSGNGSVSNELSSKNSEGGVHTSFSRGPLSERTNPQPSVTPQPNVTRQPHTPLPEEQSQKALAILEEQKRKKLQAMLSSQTLSKALPQQKEGESTKTLTAQQALEDVVLEYQQKVQAELKNVPLSRIEELLTWSENGRPVWAQSRFEALLFKVSGLSLAVPLVALGQILPMTDKLSRVVGQSDWFMGILSSSLGDIRTVNTALFVMPEQYNESFLTSAKYVVSIDGMPWGLAVDEVNQPVTLEPEDVKWRTERSKRPWLAGTVKSKMCALIDIPQVGRLLSESDKNRR